MYKTEKNACAAMDPSFFSCCPECQGEMLLCCVFSPFFLATRYVNPRRISFTKGIVLREIPGRKEAFSSAFSSAFMFAITINLYDTNIYLYDINLYNTRWIIYYITMKDIFNLCYATQLIHNLYTCILFS